jgi:hypothetical protein
MVFNIQTDLSIQYEYPSGTWNEIVADSFEVNIDRGIIVESNVFARPDIGTATVSLMKSSLADLLSGPAYKSNQNFRVRYKNNSGTFLNLFNGVIQNVGMHYVTETKKLAIQITANDLMKVVLGTQLSSFSITGSTSNRSFKNVMASLNSAVVAIDSRASVSQWLSGGSSTTQWANTWIDTPSGEIYNQLLDAELGWMWCTYDANQIRYATRSDITGLQGTAWGSTDLTVSNVHSSASYHVCMDSIDLTYNSDDIINQVKVTEMTTGISSTVTNTTSVTANGRQLGLFEVTFDYGGISTRADWATEVANAATPKRINSISVPALKRDGTVSNIVGPDIANTIQIEFASTGLPTLQETYLITRIGHTINADHWEVNFGLWKGM